MTAPLQDVGSIVNTRAMRAFAFVLIFLVAISAFAKEIELGDIVVRGLLANESAASASVTVITQDELNAKRGQTLAEVLRGIGGVDVAASGGAGQPASVFIRGAKAEHTMVLIDGNEATDTTTTTRFFDFSTLTIENIDRIEIFRGAQSTRFGADAIGGVINIISKKGSGRFGGAVNLDAGDFVTRRVSATTSGSKGALNYSVGASRFTTDGFSAADAGDGDEHDGMKRNSISTRLGYDFSSKTKFDFNARLIDSLTKLDYGGGRFGDDPNYDSAARQVLTGGVLKTELIDGLESTVGFFYGISSRRYDNQPDSARTESYQETFEGENLKAETTHRLELGKGIFDASRFELSVQYKREAAQSDQSLNGFQTKLARTGQGMFGESLFYFFKLENLKVDVGVRHDEFNVKGESIDNGSFSISYDFVVSGTSLHSSVGTGFKNPSLFQLYSKFGLASLKSERAGTFDFSLEQIVSRASLLSLTYFRNDYENLIDFDAVSSAYANVTRARSEGLEFEATSMLWQDWSIKASATALQTRDLTTGSELLRRASRSFAASMIYKRNSVEVKAMWRYVGRRDDIDPVNFTQTSLLEYDVTEFSAKYLTAFDSDFGIRIENIFDRTYQEVAGYRTSRRAVYLSFTQNF